MTDEQNFLAHRLSQRLNFSFENNAKVQRLLSEINTLNGQWKYSVSLSPQILNKLEHSAIVSSTGSSTRIEGSKLSDKQVDAFLRQTKMRKLETRDEQEVFGYLEMIRQIFEDFENIEFSELTIKQIHSVLLKYSEKDDKHRGGYKLQSNQVVAIDENNQVIGIIFDPTKPEETPQEMQDLIEWTQTALQNQLLHPLLVIANFVFEFLCIHPFKDGNGRASRILTNLLMLKNGYSLAKYVSHEKLVEETKIEYYMALKKSTNTWKTEQEDLTFWIFYILDIFKKQAQKAVDLANLDDIRIYLSEKQMQVWEVLLSKESTGRKEIHEQTGLPLPTIEKTILKLLKMEKIERFGEGRATKYRVKNK